MLINQMIGGLFREKILIYTVTATMVPWLGLTDIALGYSLGHRPSHNQRNITIIGLQQADPFALMKAESLGRLKLGMSASQVIQILGNPQNKGQNSLWGADGEYHQEWYYPQQGITLGMVSETTASPQKIFSITLKAPSKLKTKRGIGIGDSYNAVRQAYGREEDSSSSIPRQSFVAGSVYGGLIFSFQNGRVSRIFLGAAAE